MIEKYILMIEKYILITENTTTKNKELSLSVF